MVHNGILMESIIISVMVSIVVVFCRVFIKDLFSSLLLYNEVTIDSGVTVIHVYILHRVFTNKTAR